MTDTTARLELDDSHTAQLRKYTQMQLRYLVNRLAFPEAKHTDCSTSAGYPADSASVRSAEMNRKPHVRQMLNRCVDAPDEPIEDMDVESLIAWHVKMVHDPRAAIKEQQASAIELARLKGFHKMAGEQPAGVNVMDEILRLKGRTG